MAWKPLQRGQAIRDPKRIAANIRWLTATHGMPEAIARAQIEEALAAEVWVNLDVQVAVRRTPRDEGGEWVHLSFHRIDRKPIRDWRFIQRIKNELLGPECEAVELFPAESRLVDTANEFHLWGCNDPTFRFPLGFTDGRHVEGPADPESGAVQRPYREARP